MDRRRFIQMLGLAAPTLAVARSYFFAPSMGWSQTAEGIYLHNGIILSPSDYHRLVEGVKPNIWTPSPDGKRWQPVFKVAY